MRRDNMRKDENRKMRKCRPEERRRDEKKSSASCERESTRADDFLSNMKRHREIPMWSCWYEYLQQAAWPYAMRDQRMHALGGRGAAETRGAIGVQGSRGGACGARALPRARGGRNS